jgi:hypothetical protein
MKRRRRHDRLKRVRTERREDMLFFAHGRFPASARSCGMCSCGSRAFSRVGGGDLDDWYEAHSYCDVDVS